MHAFIARLSGDGPPSDAEVAFLWENAPRAETKGVRDGVACYSHLPNGIVLDDKWALARLLGTNRKGGEVKREG